MNLVVSNVQSAWNEVCTKVTKHLIYVISNLIRDPHGGSETRVRESPYRSDRFWP